METEATAKWGITMEEKLETGNESQSTGPENQEPELNALLAEWRKSEDERKEYARRQFYMTAVTAVCSLLILGVVLAAYLTVVPRTKTAIDKIQIAAEDFTKVSEQLSDLDFEELVGHVDGMAVTSEKSMQEAMEKIDAIDIDELNQAIKALSDVVTPFANFMNRFR